LKETRLAGNRNNSCELLPINAAATEQFSASTQHYTCHCSC